MKVLHIVLISIICIQLFICIYILKNNEYYNVASGTDYNTFPIFSKDIIKKLGGNFYIAQNDDVPLVPEDQDPWFWSLPNKNEEIYNKQ